MPSANRHPSNHQSVSPVAHFLIQTTINSEPAVVLLARSPRDIVAQADQVDRHWLEVPHRTDFQQIALGIEEKTWAFHLPLSTAVF
jgi:hypothetical protein